MRSERPAWHSASLTRGIGMDSKLQLGESIEDLARREDLPASYPAMAQRWFLPLAEWLCERRSAVDGCLLVGLNGAQGTGKTTLCEVLSIMLHGYGCSVLTLSLDDFYYDLPGRKLLSRLVHPLLLTRGVPGTHETDLLLGVLDTLANGGSALVPVFDKAIDDRLPTALWRRMPPADVVLLEGWCVGLTPESDEALAEPINDLEAREDVDGVWRRYVNERLREDYAEIFGRLEDLVMLKAPSLECVLEWRRLQEEKLARRRSGEGVMDPDAVARFVQHYERLTRHALETLPAQADYVLEIAEDHSVVGASTG